jgi:hydroxymethylbilane synthase
MRTMKVGTRKSKLAMMQTQQVIDQLQKLCVINNIPIAFQVIPIETKGDQILDVMLSKVGGKGLFVKEIESALLEKEIDIAVHSMKDMPVEMPDGLMIGAIPKREDPRDCMVSNRYHSIDELPKGAVIATSSLRRASQLKHGRSDLEIQSIRGNIDTRLQKLSSHPYDAIVLAAAGLHRLGWHERITQYLSVEQCVPAVGQGALCIQCRKQDSQVLEVIKQFHDEPTSLAVRAERALLARLQGGCEVPIGAYATVVMEKNQSDFIQTSIHLTGMVASIEGTIMLKEHADLDAMKTTTNDLTTLEPELLGIHVAEMLIARGADRILSM